MMYAAYYEFTLDDEVFQALLIPPFTDPEAVPARFYYRKISDATPRRVWTPVVAPKDSYPDDGTSAGGFLPETIANAVGALDGISSHMMSTLVGGWSLRGFFPLWVGDTDKVAIITGGASTRIPTNIQKTITELRRVHDLPGLPGSK